MKSFLLVLAIILLLIYGFIMIDSIILIKKSEGKRISNIRDILLKRINVGIVLTILIAIIIILRIVVFR